MKILWVSQSPMLPTGYGNVTNHMCMGLGEKGHEVYCVGMEYRGRSFSLPNYRVISGGAADMSQDILPHYLKEIKPDVVIGLHDVFRIKSWIEVCQKADVPFLNYMPIDGDQIHPSWMSVVNGAIKNVALSKYGQTRLKPIGIDAEYVYHGVDLDVFKPYPREQIDALKEKIGIADKFIIGSVSRNGNRKQIPRLLEAFKIFAADHQEARLFLHMEPRDSQGWDLPDILQRYGINDKAMFPSNIKHPYARPNDVDLAVEMNLYDIHALSTSGEGFGMPIAKSMACGIPNVATNYTTPPDLIGDTGLLADVLTMVVGQFNVDRALVDTKHMVEHFETLYSDDALRRRLSEAARNRACDLFNWKTQIDKMNNIVTDLHKLPDFIEVVD